MATDSNLMATVLDRLAYIYDDMQAWNKVWVTIINALQQQDAVLADIQRKVTPEAADEDSPLTVLLRRLVAADDAHTTALARLEAKLDTLIAGRH